MTEERLKNLGLSEYDFKPVDISTEEIIEIMAEQEFRICLLELGVTDYDL